MLFYYRVTRHWTVLLTPIFVGQTVLLVMETGMLLAALNVRYRGLFVTPIVSGDFPAASVPAASVPVLAGFEPDDGCRPELPRLLVRRSRRGACIGIERVFADIVWGRRL
jgi:hypothetical protein